MPASKPKVKVVQGHAVVSFNLSGFVPGQVVTDEDLKGHNIEALTNAGHIAPPDDPADDGKGDD